jgi:hypothetical protein
MERLTMTTLTKTGILLSLLCLAAGAENTVFLDAAFPYRIVCRTGWVQEVKNDSVLILKNTAAGKKTRLQLQKYSIDTGFDLGSKGWSRLRFAVNKEFATNIGQVIWCDTTANKKLGGLRAFEICAYFSEKSDNGTVWWAEYSRWTDYGGFGYLASVVGDTADIRQNCTTLYKALLDSIGISQLTTGAVSKGPDALRLSGPRLPAPSATVWYDVSGRTVLGRNGIPKAIVVKKSSKRLLLR